MSRHFSFSLASCSTIQNENSPTFWKELEHSLPVFWVVVHGSPIRHILALQGCYELVSQEEANIHGNGRDKRIAIQDTEVKESFCDIKI